MRNHLLKKVAQKVPQISAKQGYICCSVMHTQKKSHNHKFFLQLWDFCFGDSYGNRTRVTAVKGRCLSRLTNEPYYGSGSRI